MASSNFTAILDACVIYPAMLRDILVRLSVKGLYRAKWSEMIHEEWIRSVADTLGKDPVALRNTADLMNRAVLDCLIEDFDSIRVEIDLPDEDDRHVVQAAVRGRVDVIVTKNERDFPRSELEKLGILVEHPDTFVCHLLDLFPNEVCHTAGEMRAAYSNPAFTRDEFLKALINQGLGLSVERMKSLLDLI